MVNYLPTNLTMKIFRVTHEFNPHEMHIKKLINNGLLHYNLLRS